MLHLPLDVPRGLVQRIRRNLDGSRLIIYAYHFPGTEKLSIPPTVKNRPREKLPAESFSSMFPHLCFLRSYDKVHGKGTGMRERPTFAIPAENANTAGTHCER